MLFEQKQHLRHFSGTIRQLVDVPGGMLDIFTTSAPVADATAVTTALSCFFLDRCKWRCCGGVVL